MNDSPKITMPTVVLSNRGMLIQLNVAYESLYTMKIILNMPKYNYLHYQLNFIITMYS